jgi:PIG-X / PBN1
VAPFLARISPGLHVFHTPLDGHSDDLVCPVLRKVFSEQLKCHSPFSTFIQPPVLSERFAATASLQYHVLLPSLNELVAYLQRDICSRSNIICSHDVALLSLADGLDIDYDSISHTLTLTAFWSKPPSILYDPISGSVTEDSWRVDVQRHSEVDRVEVGVLSQSPATDAHDIQLSGFLTVIGQDDQPKPTLFHFPSRHHSVPGQQSQQRYTVSVQQPQGLHPTLQISFPSASTLTWPENRPKDSHCALQSYIVLPSYIFADEYAFNSGDPLFAESHHIRATHSISGETDLEAPDNVVRRWGSTLLIEPALPSTNGSRPLSSDQWDVTVPLHLRYLSPTQGGQSRVDLAWPIVYWACTAEEGTKFPVNPFDRVNLGFEGLYGPRTMFYHLEPNPVCAGDSRLVNVLDVPVYDSSMISANTIELTTLIVVVGGFFWVAAKLWPGLITQIWGSEKALEGDGRANSTKKQQ